jgi:hypothetical protein
MSKHPHSPKESAKPHAPAKAVPASKAADPSPEAPKSQGGAGNPVSGGVLAEVGSGPNALADQVVSPDAPPPAQAPFAENAMHGGEVRSASATARAASGSSPSGFEYPKAKE